MEESFVFCCPLCLQHTAVTVSFESATASGRQRFVEDCQNCCEPIEIDVVVREGAIERLDYHPANG